MIDMTKNLPVINLEELEKKLLLEEQVDCGVVHHFSPGLYVREVKMPAGTFAIGHRQKKKHLNIFLKGKLTMLNEDGSTSEMEAPMLFTGRPGRKMGYVHEDVVWLNVYNTEETDVSTLELIYLDKSDSWKSAQQFSLPKLIDQEDYKRVLLEHGVTEKIAREQSENEDDQIPFPSGSYAVAVFPSSIEGVGLYATATFRPGDVIVPARLGGKRTPAGRYTNHSKNPNAVMKMINNDIYLIALKDIVGCKGGQLGMEITTNYRESLKLAGEILCQE